MLRAQLGCLAGRERRERSGPGLEASTARPASKGGRHPLLLGFAFSELNITQAQRTQAGPGDAGNLHNSCLRLTEPGARLGGYSLE